MLLQLDTYLWVIKQIKHATQFIGCTSYPLRGQKILVKTTLKYTAELSTVRSSHRALIRKPSSIKLCFIFNAAQACSPFAKIMEL